MQGGMHAQIVKFVGCLIWTQLGSAEADHKNITLTTQTIICHIEIWGKLLLIS